MAQLAASVPTKRLAAAILSTDSSFTLNNILSWDGINNIAAADFGTYGRGCFRNTTNTQIEFFTFDPATVANSTITILTRGNNYSGGTADAAKTKYNWPANSTLVELGANVPSLFEDYVDKASAETITAVKTFASGATPIITDAPSGNTDAVNKAYADGLAIAGAPNASTTVKGIVEEATQAEVLSKTAAGGTAARLFVSPTTLASTLLSDYKADTGSANAYAIAPSPAITAYTVGQIFTFKTTNANTLTSTLNVNALGTKTITRMDGTALEPGDIISGQVCVVQYDGTNFQLLNPTPSSIPSGFIGMTATAAAPTGWLLCDGTSYLRTTYVGLFTAISTTYGSADGTHFNVPDMRGRVAVGVGTGTGGGASGTGLPTGGSALTAVARAGWKGEETHTLTTPEMPAHTHPESGSVGSSANGGSGSTPSDSGLSGLPNTGSTGGGGAHNNIQPVMGLNYIIKI